MTTLEHITGDSLTGADRGSAARLTLLWRAYAAELIKLRSIRSTFWLLGLTALSLIGMGVVNAIGFVVHAAQDPAFDRVTIDPAGGSLSGLGSAWLPVSCLPRHNRPPLVPASAPAAPPGRSRSTGDS